MLQLDVKIPIAKYQLAFILDDCFSDKELLTLTTQCGIRCEYEQKHLNSKDWFARNLADAFFEQALAGQAVNQCLVKKAQKAICRVGYMNMEEIQTFLQSPTSLLEDGEFGEIVWALLIDSRETVQQHGQKLLLEHERTLNATISEKESANSAKPNSSEKNLIPESNHFNADETKNSNLMLHALEPKVYTYNGGTHALTQKPIQPSSLALQQAKQQILEQDERIKQLQQALDELRGEYTTLKRKNNELKEQLKQVSKENQTIKEKEYQYREAELLFQQLKQENQTLREKECQYKETELHIVQQEHENQALKEELEDLSNKFDKFHRMKIEKATLAIELRAVEESVYRTQEIIEQMACDFQAQMAHLKKFGDVSKDALAHARQKITNLASEQDTDKKNRNHSTTIEQARVGVFVDVQNMFYAAKDRYAGRVDYIKLLDLIVGPRQLVVAYAYVVQIPEINQSGFLSLLEHNGYTIKSKDLRLRGDGTAKGDWDVGIAIDIVSMLEALDVVILASGDGDFCALAEMIKQKSKRVEVVAFEHNTSMDLQRLADQFFPIGDDLLI